MLIDLCPSDRAKGINGLLGSDIADERDAGAREIVALLVAVPNFWQTHTDAVFALAEAAAATTCPRRCGGQVLVVRESGSRRGNWYPVVDGHLSDRGGLPIYADLTKAMMAAEQAAYSGI
jgi:hypothetical protein